MTAATPLRLRDLQRGGERGGSASVEAAIGAVALIALLTFGLAVGRLTAAEAAVTEAAHAAARLGSAVRGGARRTPVDTRAGASATASAAWVGADIAVHYTEHARHTPGSTDPTATAGGSPARTSTSKVTRTVPRRSSAGHGGL